MIWILMALMCLYGFFGDETWPPRAWQDNDWMLPAMLAITVVGAILLSDEPVMAACWAFSCLLAAIGATRPGWKA